MNSSISSSDGKPFKRYLAAYFMLLGAATSLLIPNYFFLKNNGEFLSLPKIVEIQSDTSIIAIYGTALHDDTFFYKQALLDRLKPEVVALGSSRMLLMRKEFFKKPFANMAGTMGSPKQGIVIADKIMNTDINIETVLIGVDFWWFNEKLSHTFQTDEPQRITLKKILLPFKWLYEGKISVGDYSGRINPFFTRDNKSLIGIHANKNGSGFAPDGSYFYSNAFIGERYNRRQVDMYVDMVKNGTSRFTYSDRLDMERFNNFKKMLQLFKSKGINTIVLLTPVAPSVAAEMKICQAKFKYITDLRAELGKSGIRYYDFIDPSFLGSSDSEFYDGIHGSELTYCKILDFICKDQKDLKDVVDIAQVRKHIDNPEMINNQPHKRNDMPKDSSL